MKAADNPYNYGAGARPPELAGRESIIERAQNIIERTNAGKAPKSLILLGLRGVGKTVMLNEFEAMAEKAECLATAFEADQKRKLPEQLAPHLTRILIKLDRLKAAEHHAQRAWTLLKAFASVFKVKLAGIEISVNKDVVTGDLAIDLTDLFLEIGNAAAARKTAVVIMLDEVQSLSEEDMSALIVALHKVSQRQLPFLVFGAGLPQLPRLAGDAKSYAERLFDYLTIGKLDDDSARQALVEPARRASVKYSKDALAWILKETQGYPYYLQLWGSHAWEVAPSSPITLKHAKDATKRAIETLDGGIFNSRLQRLTERQQDYARAMAELPLPATSTQVATVLAMKIEQAAAMRDELIKKGMAYSPKRGLIDFTVPLFDAFLRRKIPIFRAGQKKAPAKKKSRQKGFFD